MKWRKRKVKQKANQKANHTKKTDIQSKHNRIFTLDILMPMKNVIYYDLL